MASLSQIISKKQKWLDRVASNKGFIKFLHESHTPYERIAFLTNSFSKERHDLFEKYALLFNFTYVTNKSTTSVLKSNDPKFIYFSDKNLNMFSSSEIKKLNILIQEPSTLLYISENHQQAKQILQQYSLKQ